MWRISRNSKYCSLKCYWENKHDRPWNKGTKGLTHANRGTFLSSEVKFKGTLSEYKSLHYKVRKAFGKPKKCERCPETENIEWANKSGRYLESRQDWLALCRKCHYKYDKTEERRWKNIYEKK